MKLVCTGDWHLRSSNPINRIDKNYLESLQEKGNFIFDYMLDNNISILLHGGDWMDHPIVSDEVKTWLMKRLKDFDCFSVIGNHDQTHRQVINNSSISVMIESERITRLINIPKTTNEMKIYFYGVSFGEEIPKIALKNKYNILVIHKMISDRDLWSGHVEYSDSKMFLTKHKFDLIVSSDNHTSFVTKLGNRLLINPGSLCRARIDQRNHKPCFFVIDTDTQEYEQVFIPVKPAEEVFNFNIKEKKPDNEDLTKLISELKLRRNHEFNYLKQAEEIALESDLDEWIKGSMMEVINEINQKGLK